MSSLHSQLDAATELERTISENAAPSLNCGEDPIATLKTMFVDMAMGARIQRGQEPVQRPVFLKPHGVARGAFTIRPDLPAELLVGLFRYESFVAWVRFASDTVPTLPDLRTTLGIAIKLFGVPGEKLLENEPHVGTHDLIMQNHDVFFVDTAKDMCEFTYAGVVDGDYASYLATHPRTAQILADMQKVVSSVLHSDYWSALPYAFGEGRYVKYKLSPCIAPTLGAEPDTNDPG